MVSKTQRDAAQAYAEEQLEQVAITGRKESEFRKRDQIDADIASKKSQNRLRGAQFSALMKELNKTEDEADDILAGMLEYTENLFSGVDPASPSINNALNKIGFEVDKYLDGAGNKTLDNNPSAVVILNRNTGKKTTITLDSSASSEDWILDFTDNLYPLLDKNELEILYENSVARSQRGGDSFPKMEDWLAANPGKTVLDYNNAKAAFDEQNK